MRLRVRSETGVHTVQVDDNKTIGDLFAEVAALVSLDVGSFQLLNSACRPPKALTSPHHTLLSEAGVQNGDALVLERTAGAAQTAPSAQSQTHHQTQPQTQPQQAKPQAQQQQQQPPPQAKPESDHPVMIRHVVPSDNSCLFNSVGFVLFGRNDMASELRELCAATVASDPDNFNETFLGRNTDEYVTWILDSEHWGGAIELSILSTHFKTEIAAFDIQTQRMYCYGESSNFSKRVYLLYDGIHYDALALSPFEGAPADLMCAQFSPSDADALQAAQRLVLECHNKHDFTDLTGMSIRCGVCYKGFRGTKEAIDHQKQTGHANFQQVSK